MADLIEDLQPRAFQHQLRGFCPRCQAMTLHLRSRFPWWLGLLLTFLTGFLFLLLWPLIALWNSGCSWFCSVCGQKQELKRSFWSGKPLHWK